MPGKLHPDAQDRQSSHASGQILLCALDLVIMACHTFWYDAGELPGEPGLPAASFSDLPARKVLTLNMDVPEPWLVEPVQVCRLASRTRSDSTPCLQQVA